MVEWSDLFDKDAVGAFGVSHSGELILKAASEITFGCGVPNEGAANEYLEIDIGPTAPRKDNEIQFQDVALVRQRADKAKAMERGYAFIYRQADGSYKPDSIQQQAWDVYMAFFDKHLKHTHGTASTPR